MSDLTATNCGCSTDNGCGCNSIIWIILLLSCCGNGSFCGNNNRMRMQWRRKRLLLADSSSVILWRMQWRRKRMRRNLLIFVLETCAARCTTKKGCSICIPFCPYKMLSFFCGFFFLDLTFHSLFYPAFRGNIPSFQAFFIHFINTVSINNQSLMHLFFPFLLLYSYRQAFSHKIIEKLYRMCDPWMKINPSRMTI